VHVVCLDLEGVLVPEIWIEFSKRTGIPELSRTTRDEPDYDKLMRGRLALLDRHGLGLSDIQQVIGAMGPLPGALALGIHTAGFLGKFFSESLERVDGGVYEAVSATGASRLQVVMYAGWPSILREALGYTLYIFDRNVRMAAVLGLVGAGGIGLALHDTLRMFNYNESAALIIVILVTILIIDYLSTWLRGKLN